MFTVQGLLSFVLKLLIFYSMFDVGRSMFDVRGALSVFIRVQFKRSPAEGCKKLVRVCSCVSACPVQFLSSETMHFLLFHRDTPVTSEADLTGVAEK